MEIGNLGLGNFRGYAGEAGKEKHEVVSSSVWRCEASLMEETLNVPLSNL